MLKKIFGLIILSVALLVACGESEDKKDADKDLALTTTEDKAKVEAIVDAKVEAAKLSREEVEQAILQIYKENIWGMQVEFIKKDKLFRLIPTDEDLISEINDVYTGELDKSNWNGMVDELVELSKIQQEKLGDGYKIAIINPVNTDNVLLMIEDGEIYYDVMNE